MNDEEKLDLRKEKLCESLKALSDNPDFFAKPGHLFSGSEKCLVWTGSEETFFKDEPIADYYGNYAKTGKGNPRFEKWITKNKLFWEWHDCGTIMIYDE